MHGGAGSLREGLSEDTAFTEQEEEGSDVDGAGKRIWQSCDGGPLLGQILHFFVHDLVC